jgi:predicted esterase
MRKRYFPLEKNHFRKEISISLPFDFIYKQGSSRSRKVFLLLHGYEESAQKIFDKVFSILPEEAHIFAANGPFPIPRKTAEGYKVGFSWYFYDFTKKEYYIDMQIALNLIQQSLINLNLQEHEITVIGFSQGGYLAPLVGLQFSKTQQVIGIGCEYLTGEFAQPLPFPITAIHGEKDSIVSIKDAKISFEKIQANPGTFYALPQTEHRIDTDVLGVLKKLLS